MTRLYLSSVMYLTGVTIEDMKKGIEHYFLSLQNSFETGKYFTTYEAACRDRASQFDTKDLNISDDRKVVFSVEVDCADNGEQRVWAVTMINSMDFPGYDQSVVINASPKKILDDCNAMRNPACHTHFTLGESFSCHEKNFQGSFSSLPQLAKAQRLPVVATLFSQQTNATNITSQVCDGPNHSNNH